MQKQSIKVVVLALFGFYMLLVHKAPLPLNHEAIGLGTNHLAHGIVGALLLVGVGFLWHKNKKNKAQV